MEQYRTNQFMTINDKFLLIENHFMVLSNNSPNKKLIKLNSHLNLFKRPALKKKKKILSDKENIRNPLDQIGNDDLIFNNDKLITNIKLDSLNDNSKDNDSDKSNSENEKNNDEFAIRTKNKKVSLTPVREKSKKTNIQKIIFNKNWRNSKDNDSLQLTTNKIVNSSKTNIKTNNNKNHKNYKNLIQPNRLKNLNNINQFINKPNDNNNNIINNQKNLLNSPSINKKSSKLHHNSFNKLNNLKLTQKNELHNDSISIGSISRVGFSNSARVKSLPNSLKKNNIHFPNKSVIKNKEKLYTELEKIFGDKLQLCDDIYQNMLDADKRNCIIFLLESIKELYNMNKALQIKNDNYKELIDSKDKQIKELKSEIKELKKDITKLNKIIKTNIQMNRKLSQNVDALKIQLEKEKNKNKEIQFSRGNSSTRNFFNSKNGIKSFSVTNNHNRNKFQREGRFRDTNEFINKKKRININKSLNNRKEKNTLNINSIKILESKDNKNFDKIENSNEDKEKENENNLDKVLSGTIKLNEDKKNT